MVQRTQKQTFYDIGRNGKASFQDDISSAAFNEKITRPVMEESQFYKIEETRFEEYGYCYFVPFRFLIITLRFLAKEKKTTVVKIIEFNS